jgi:outer membrane protein assembly factor BamA
MNTFNPMKYAFATLLALFATEFLQGQDTLKPKDLPFTISEIKKLDDEELMDKREGTFVTGVPDFNVDPLNGFGYGVEGSLIFNGKKSNPFFEYTPYDKKIDMVLFNTSRQQREFILTYDQPYIFHSKWRLRGEVGYEKNPNLLYFGLNKNTLQTLSQLSSVDGIPANNTSDNYTDYENALGANGNFNTYTKEEYIFNVSGEYALLDSRMRILAGFEIAQLNITTNQSEPSRIRLDALNNQMLGVGKSLVTFLQLGIVYDTRDFEPDPNRGVFAEVTDEYGSHLLGSDYNMNKLFGQVKFYKRLFLNTFKKVVWANRAGAGYTFGSSPFFEYQDEWSSEGSIEGLGGANTLRGYKQSRFLDRGMYFVNSELRVRLFERVIAKQNVGFGLVPFVDAGSVFNTVNDLRSKGSLRYSYGMGARIIWNQSTILRFDLAHSKEDQQFFFTFDHAF